MGAEVYCIVFQRVAVCCIAVQCARGERNLQIQHVFCFVLQCVAVCCIVAQCAGGERDI